MVLTHAVFPRTSLIPMHLVSGEGRAGAGVCVELVGYDDVGGGGSGNWQLVFVIRLETCSRRLGIHGRLWSAMARAVPS